MSSTVSPAEKRIIQLLNARMPALHYHNIDHVYDVLNSAIVIAENEKVSTDEIKLLRLAALYHDAGFIFTAKDHEERGVQMAREILPADGIGQSAIEQISGMILATRTPQSPTTKMQQILCDADLDYLGRDDFYETGKRLFEEMKANGAVSSEQEWNGLQKKFLEAHHYHTDYSKANREPEKQKRLIEIAQTLATWH